MKIFRVFKFALQKLWRNSWLSVVTISVLVLALISVNSIIIFRYIGEQSIKLVEDKIDISIYFKKNISEPEIENLQRFLSELDNIESVKRISSQDALESFKQRHSNSESIINSLNELDENPLSDSLTVRASEVEDYDKILNILSTDVYKDLIANTSFEDYRTLINKMNEFLYKIEIAGYTMSIFFMLMAVMIIYNTVRINVYNYKEEIAIMKLVGATNAFVRSPFIIESVLVGIISVCIVMLILYPIINLVQPYLVVFFGFGFDLFAYFKDNAIIIIGGQILTIIIVNIIASGFAVGRYLRV